MAESDSTDARSPASVAGHWDRIHKSRPPPEVSWYEPWPTMSLRMLDALGATVDDAIVDVGGGSGMFAAVLAEAGYRAVTLVELSAEALTRARKRCEGTRVDLVHQDVLDWRPERRYDVWHDRAVFHFLTTTRQRRRYRASLYAAIRPGGGAVIGVFAGDGPPTCSGLPVSRYNPGELAHAVGDGFTVIAKAREVHQTPKGVVQPFTWLALRRVG